MEILNQSPARVLLCGGRGSALCRARGLKGEDRLSLFPLHPLAVCVWVGRLTSGLDSPPGADEGFAERRSRGVAHN